MVKAKQSDVGLNKECLEIATRNGIPVWQFEIALGIRPLKNCQAIDVKEAEEVARRAIKDSEEEMAAILSWDHLALELAKAAESLDEKREAYMLSRKGSESKRFSLAKWVEHIEAIIYSPTATPEDCKYALHNCPATVQIKEEILARWSEISLLQARVSITTIQAKEACFKSPRIGEARKVLLLLWIKLCDTEVEVMEVLKFIQKEPEENPKCPVRNEAILRIVEISEVEKAESLKKATPPKNKT